MENKKLLDNEISFCSSTCDETECIRNKIHAPWPDLPHVYAEFKGTKYCPTKKEEEDDPLGGMELGNLLFGHSRGNYLLDRYPAQDLFGDFFEEFGLDVYGYPDRKSVLFKCLKQIGSDGAEEIQTDVFTLFPYYWNDDEELIARANFVYKPENIEIRWYKYPMRDAYSNVKLDEAKLREIMDRCAQCVRELKGD